MSALDNVDYKRLQKYFDASVAKQLKEWHKIVWSIEEKRILTFKEVLEREDYYGKENR
jgi:hypothetical protein